MMTIDHHFHLEEGPYSIDWLRRTAQALINSEGNGDGNEFSKNTLSWIGELGGKLGQRLSEGCFTEEWLGRYLKLGKSRGIVRFGIVDHLYRFDEFQDYYKRHVIVDDSPLGQLQRRWLEQVRIGSIEPFLQLIRSTQQKGEPISLGVEADYFPGGESELRGLLGQYEFDYIIGSVHFIDGWGFDNPQTQDRFQQEELIPLYRKLFDHLIGAIRSGLFDIIAHPDNLKVFGYRPDETALLPMYEEAAAAMKEADVATEINTGLAYRYPVKEMCPSRSFLQVLFRHGVPITLSSDSHFPDDIGTMLDQAAELAVQTGYRDLIYFERRERRYHPL